MMKNSENLSALVSKNSSNNNSSNNNSKNSVDNTINYSWIQLVRELIKGNSQILNEKILIAVCQKVKPIFDREPNLLKLKAPIYVCGDIHGQFTDLLHIFKNIGFPPKVNYLFLGDYVDRGKQSLEVITLLFLLKIKYPKNIYLIRGNHECASINKMYGFYDECRKRQSVSVWKAFNVVFNSLPISALIDKKIFCVHGGLSPNFSSLGMIDHIKRGTCIPDNGLLCDLTWSDPANHKKKWEHNDRGVSYTFNSDVAEDFIKKTGVELIVRAHQVVNKGYEFHHGGKVLTVFSAPNYCSEYGNSGAVLKVENDLTCSFVIFKPTGTKK